MNNILLIESGTNVCSVAIAIDGSLAAIKESSDEKAHAAQLTVFIDQLIKETGVSVSQLDAVAVSKGPGSYTGLRIGVSTAKGICFASEKPLISVSSLDSMVQGANIIYCSLIEQHRIDFFCPMIDAKRMEVYSALYDRTFSRIGEIEALIVDESTFTKHLSAKRILFFGNGAIKCTNVMNHPNAFFVNDFAPSARFMIPLAVKSLNNQLFEDIAYFEPYYLKDFVATKSQKKVIPGLK